MAGTSSVRCTPLTPADWPALVQLFGPRGACGGCWCMLWRAPYGGARFEADKGAANRRTFRELVTRGRAHGCLAWQDDSAIGWVSVGPRESFPYFERTRALAPIPGDAVWSITCFYVPAARRRGGIALELLRAAVDLARSRGARIVEGYPVTSHDDAPVSPTFAWTGVPRLFERAGFERHRLASGRLVYRLTFPGPARATRAPQPSATRRLRRSRPGRPG